MYLSEGLSPVPHRYTTEATTNLPQNNNLFYDEGLVHLPSEKFNVSQDECLDDSFTSEHPDKDIISKSAENIWAEIKDFAIK